MRVTRTVKGAFSNLERFFNRMTSGELYSSLEKFGAEGVAALSSATPKESGITAGSWGYEVKVSQGLASIVWTNSHVVGGAPLVIMLQYGHGTGTGGYVVGRDFINPAIKPIFDKIEAGVWKVVTSA